MYQLAAESVPDAELSKVAGFALARDFKNSVNIALVTGEAVCVNMLFTPLSLQRQEIEIFKNKQYA